MNTQTARRPNPLATLLILWAAMLSTQAIFILIARTATSGSQPSNPDSLTNTIPDYSAPAATGTLPIPMFVALAAVSVLLAYFLPKLIAKAQIAKLKQEGGTIPLEKIIPIAVTTKVIRWAMLESVTLYGLILSLTNADPNLILPFAAVALVGFALSFPSEKGIRGALGVN